MHPSSLSVTIVLVHFGKVKLYGEPAPLLIMVTLITLLIELKTQILKVSSFDNRNASYAQTCEMVNKNSKTLIAI